MFEHQDGLRSRLGYGSPCHDCRSDAFHACANVFTLILLRLLGIVVGSFQRTMKCLPVDRRRVKRYIHIRLRLSDATVRRRVFGQSKRTDRSVTV